MITIEQQLSVLTSEVLRDLGRNEGAGRSIRKMAIKLLIEKKHPFANHPDFRELRIEIDEENEAHAEVESLIAQVEPVRNIPQTSDIQKVDKGLQGTDEELQMQCEPEEYSGPLKASFTTKNL